MKFLLNMTCDNAAFHGEDCKGEILPLQGSNVPCGCPELESEIIRILRAIADRIDRDGLSGFFETIHDLNGNDVGRFAIKPDSYRP